MDNFHSIKRSSKDFESMPSFLMSLPVEVHLIIIEELKHDRKLNRDSYEPSEVEDFLQHRDLMNWSCTAKYFRNLLAPYIFSEVNFRIIDERSGNSIQRLLNGPHGILIKELNVVGPKPLQFIKMHYDAIECHGLEVDAKESARKHLTLPRVAEELLSNLFGFSSLVSLNINLAYPFDDSATPDYTGLYQQHYNKAFERTYDPDVYILQLRQYWKLLITKVYSLVSACRTYPPCVFLTLENVLFQFPLPFQQTEFQELLNKVECFILQFSETGDLHLGRPEVRNMAKLDLLVFNHLHNASYLHLAGSKYWPIGLQGPAFDPLPLNNRLMPMLQFLKLEKIFICDEIVKCFEFHSNTLEELVLKDCYSSVDFDVEGPPFYWKDLFNGLSNAKLTKLVNLQIEPLQPVLTESEAYNSLLDINAESHDEQKVRKVLKMDKNRPLFSYMLFDWDDYDLNYLKVDNESNVEEFQKEDQAAYGRLQKMIVENASTR